MEVNNTNFYNSTGINNTTNSPINSQPATATQTESGQTAFSGKADQLSLSQAALQKSQIANQSDSSTGAKVSNGGVKQLSQADKQLVQKLQTRDLHVRRHEAAHLAVAGPYAKGGPSFQYQIGPDGKAYAIGGEVSIDLSPIPGNPQATITKEETVRQAALAPVDPSGADLAVAGEASQLEVKAQTELQEKKASTQNPKADSTAPANLPANQTEDNTTNPVNTTTDNSAGNRFKNLLSQAYQGFSKLFQVGQVFNQKA